MTTDLRSRLSALDTVRLAVMGIRSRLGRSVLTAIGIAIGIAALISVVGISASSRADLLDRLDRLGTNLIRVGPGQGILGGPAALPDDAPAMTARIGPVERVTAVSLLDATVRRSDLIPEIETGGLSVIAVQEDLVDVLGATVLVGRFIDGPASRLPVLVLGRVAAERLGVGDLAVERLVFIDGSWFTVVGIVGGLELHPDLERSAMMGEAAAEARFGEIEPTAIYVRVEPEQSEDVVDVLPATVNPENPDQVEITRPADALAAREAADAALTQLLVALGSVALVVGGVAIANVMVMSVLERRMEIGVRRALGATRAHIRRQFLLEAVVLAVAGGVAGLLIGGAISWIIAIARDLPMIIPPLAIGGAMSAAVLVGVVAGLYPATRAARIPPSEAVRG